MIGARTALKQCSRQHHWLWQPNDPSQQPASMQLVYPNAPLSRSDVQKRTLKPEEAEGGLPGLIEGRAGRVPQQTEMAAVVRGQGPPQRDLSAYFRHASTQAPCRRLRAASSLGKRSRRPANGSQQMRQADSTVRPLTASPARLGEVPKGSELRCDFPGRPPPQSRYQRCE